MEMPNSRTAKKLARVGADFASINITDSHVTLRQAGRELQICDKTEGS